VRPGATSAAPKLSQHRWTRIVYPPFSEGDLRQFALTVSLSNAGADGIRMELIYARPIEPALLRRLLAQPSTPTEPRVGEGGQGTFPLKDLIQLIPAPSPSDLPPAPASPASSDVRVRLHSRSGESIVPLEDDNNRYDAGSGNAGWMYRFYRYAFPWQPETLEEAWIECRFLGVTYWLEVPYGFTGDATAPLRGRPTVAGIPTIASAMTPPTEKARIVRWRRVEYDVGDQPDWKTSLWISNAPMPQAAVVLAQKGNEKPVSTSAALAIEDASGLELITGTKEGGYKRHQFTLSASEGVERSWGVAAFDADGRSYAVTLPSSLFRAGHGHAPTPTDAGITLVESADGFGSGP
jgi:hypothetical protein